MSDQTPAPQNPQAPAPKFDPNAPHQQKPKLRMVRGFPAKLGDQQVIGLADARQITDRVVLLPPAIQFVLPHLNGEKTIDQVVAEVGRGLTRPVLESIVAQLDEAGFLIGPRFDAILKKVRDDFDASPNLPPASTAAFADVLAVQEAGQQATDEQKAEIGPRRLREVMDQWIDKALEKAPNPSFDSLPKAVMAPHIDYPRGWINYGSVWGRMRVVDRPDRIVILGTNHFGQSTGVAGCDKGYETPLGLSRVDEALAGNLERRLGSRLWENKYDHEREHSIELQIAWIQHCLGKNDSGEYCRVFGALVHDPSVNGGKSYDGAGVDLEPFVEALRAAIAELPGRTLIVSSADLSHVGPGFGDQQPVNAQTPEAEAFRNRVIKHDQDMLNLVVQRKPQDLVASMAWMQNPTRWCSVGNIVATMMAAQPESVQLLNYAAAIDQPGMGMVTSAAMAMV